MIEGIVWLVLATADATNVHAAESHRITASHHSLRVQSRNSISGSVYNPSRRPVENLRVELLDEVDGVLASTYTSSSGRYAFYGLSSGIFQVRVLTTGTGYQGRTERVTITASVFGGRSSQSEQLDIFLSPTRGLSGTAASSGMSPGVVFVQEVPHDAKEEYERALKEVGRDSPGDKVIAVLRRAVAIFPDYYAALDLLGQEYIKRGDYEAAQPVLTRAVSVNKRSSSSWYALGYTQYKRRLLPDAAESLTKSASLNAKSPNTHLVLGTVRRLRKEWDAAETHLKQARSLSKRPVAEVHWQLALLYNQTRRFAEAADELDTFLRVQPDSRDSEKIQKLISEMRRKK